MNETKYPNVYARIQSLEEYSGLVPRLLGFFYGIRIFAFYGAMGVGKTTLIQFFCKHLEVSNVVTSPSYSLINEYVTRNNEIIYHFDFYRINKIEEVYDLGYEEYFYSGRYCFIEWPEKLGHLLPTACVKIHMEDQCGERIIKV